MQIVTLDTESPEQLEPFTTALREMLALRVSRSTWIIPGNPSAAALVVQLGKLLPDQERDTLFIAQLDAMAEVQWENAACSDEELSAVIRMGRESALR